MTGEETNFSLILFICSFIYDNIKATFSYSIEKIIPFIIVILTDFVTMRVLKL